MLPEEVLEKDVTVEIDYNKIYDLIYSSEKEMKEMRTESPPWDKKELNTGQKIKEFTNGIKMYFKVRDIINSAKITPKDSEKDIKSLTMAFIKMMGKGEDKKEREGIEEEDNFNEKEIEENSDIVEREVISGKVIKSWGKN